MKEKETYYVKHITTSDNCEKIKKDGFICSKHIPDMSKNSIQWLGDGVYFWDANDTDEKALKIQMNQVKKKKKNKGNKIASIKFLMEVEKESHVNLLNSDWEQNFIEFLDTSNSLESNSVNYFKDGKELLELLEMITNKKNVDSAKLQKIGMLFGTCINLYLTILSKEMGKNIKLISHIFYHKGKKTRLFGKNELCLKQFCVKDENIIPTKSKQMWKIEYI